MAEIQMSTDSLFIGPINMRIYRFDAYPFDKTNQKTSREHLRHGLKFRRFRIKLWYCLRFRNAESKVVFDAWFQRFFHEFTNCIRPGFVCISQAERLTV